MPLILDRGLRRSLLKKSSKYRRKAVRAAFAATRVVRDEEAAWELFVRPLHRGRGAGVSHRTKEGFAMSGSDDEVLIVGEIRAGGDPASGDERAAKRPRNGADLGGAPSANNQPRSAPPSKTRPSIAEMKRALDAAGVTHSGMERGELEAEFERVQSSFSDPPLFRLLTTDPADLNPNTSGNAGCVSLRDIVSGPVRWCVVMNFMIDLPWLLSPDGCPELLRIPKVVWIGDERSSPTPNDPEFLRLKGERDWTVVNPPCPKFGTHHTKCFILVYDTGVRVCVHTANLIHGDVRKRTNAAWCQDFPNKSAAHLGRSSEFERDLGRYLATLGWKDETCALPGAGGDVVVGPSAMSRFDFSGAGAKLIASVPGRWVGSAMMNYGHTSVRHALAGMTFPGVFKRAPVVCQFTSVGATTEKWMGEMARSFGAGATETDDTNEWPGGPSLGDGELRLVWPTMGEVRGSNLGYVTGGSIPGATDKISREHVRRRLHRWRGGGDETTKEGTKLLDHPPASTDPTGRGRVMPHVKTFARYAPNAPHDLAWVIVGSHNLSGAAWGRLEKNETQIAILSYELGVLLSPRSIGKTRVAAPFTCTPGAVSHRGEVVPRCLCLANARPPRPGEVDGATSGGVRISAASDDGPGDSPPGDSREFVAFAPLPYRVPPVPYAPSDAPWAVDAWDETPDKYGRVMRGGIADRFNAS